MAENGSMKDALTEGMDGDPPVCDRNTFDNHVERRMEAFDIASMLLPDLEHHQMPYVLHVYSFHGITADLTKELITFLSLQTH